MTVTIPICLAFAIQVSHYHSMRKAAVPVPPALILNLATDHNRDAITYALSVPRLWNRAKVEIWAQDDCESNNKEFSYNE